MSERLADVTLHEVARIAGVSASTASRAINGGDKKVSPDLERRVKAVANSLGYVPSLSARALRGRRTAIILLVNDPRTASIAATAAGMEEAGRAAGVVVTVSATGPDPEARLAAIRTLRALNPRAFVVAANSVTGAGVRQEIKDELADYQRSGGGLVIIGDSELAAPTVRFNDYESARVIGAYMGGLGRRKAAILTTSHPAFAYRTEGFLDGLSSHGFKAADVRIVECELSRAGGRAAALELAGSGAPDLVLAGNDVLAIGALGGFRSAGLKVPDDVALSGVDDIPLAQDVLPGLTTVAFPFKEAGRRALRLALNSSEYTEQTEHLRGALVVRGSTLLSTAE
ncbi:LacI family transcriptional regulator [Pseudarthrobacter sp. NamE2]|uniref:LacI family DNA-binding transcriptional regulator n=1 Tax=Pseudarthrobacter sp. NamE2 TaxID=2576838 RepID=UPI0010FE336C|nr:LacI family DNA-binding transcriptional regulator [Pseudarthrobacter sp. NamE2]TLM83574.1 LacI family transcriptional regulator [Pseudarthrobacter sp. NamE2]